MLQARRLEKIIENRRVLYIEQLEFDAGNIVAAVGLANSGKTLLIRLLCGSKPSFNIRAIATPYNSTISRKR